MSFDLTFFPEAAAEAECVTGDYEARSPGLGRRFRKEIESICSALVQHPLLWRQRPEGFRRVNLPGFPYYLAFVVDEPQILVIAVVHSSRRPGYFRTRIP